MPYFWMVVKSKLLSTAFSSLTRSTSVPNQRQHILFTSIVRNLFRKQGLDLFVLLVFWILLLTENSLETEEPRQTLHNLIHFVCRTQLSIWTRTASSSEVSNMSFLKNFPGTGLHFIWWRAWNLEIHSFKNVNCSHPNDENMLFA